MKIAYSPYQLKFSNNFGTLGERETREGALLKIIFEDGLIGYCDCHPWVELGDQSLQEQLAALSHPEQTPLLRCSFRFARIDAKGRRDRRSVFEELSIPPSHQLISLDVSPETCIAEGITHFKLKVGLKPESEIPTLHSWIEKWPTIKLRLDFNEKLARLDFLDYWRSFSPELKRRIDFVEDPYSYDGALWTKDQQHLGVCYAADRAAIQAAQEPDSARYLVHKPAVEETIRPGHKNTRLVVTSYIDHPFGQMCAAYAAAKLKVLYPKQVDFCGLLTHKCYQSTPFVDAISASGAMLSPPNGTGFGFNHLLEELPWQNL